MTAEWINQITEHQRKQGTYSLRDFEIHFSDDAARHGLADFRRKYGHKSIEFLNTSGDFSGLIVPSIAATIAEYGEVQSVGQQIAQTISESRETVTKRFLWKNEGVEDYLEGQPFNETYFEGASHVIRWRKPGAKIAETYETIKDLPLDVVQANVRLTLPEFTVRDNQHFMHEMHKATSNVFDPQARDKHGNALTIPNNDGEQVNAHWRALFDNALDRNESDHDTLLTWDDVAAGRAKMFRRARDAVLPRILVTNASNEQNLASSTSVNDAKFWGAEDTYFRKGELPPVYGLTFIIVPDAYFGYFTNDVTLNNDEFVTTNDAFLLTPEGTVFRHTREPLSTEAWTVYDGQKQALNIWERYEYSTFKFTNVLRIVKSGPE